MYGWFIPVALLIHADGVFPLIPSAFGGGALQSAEVFIRPEGQQFFRTMKLNVDASGLIGKWSIVVELPDAIVITGAKSLTLESAKTIWVHKDRTEALMYSDRKP